MQAVAENGGAARARDSQPKCRRFWKNDVAEGIKQCRAIARLVNKAPVERLLRDEAFRQIAQLVKRDHPLGSEATVDGNLQLVIVPPLA